ncbi:hypothetical protein A2642_03540 [Candidatus Nomurabacteria bacterium RIFCSPHIGHO2_01_FULL_39_10]|uniref:Uncharacterized protein n=1 Tax=Candidatus Nomurabacteria bacterium RIFCSPHIGHO2_01_FULL_39_10 TaxID=1801733 RepID=A0A1F6VAQ5_9BACT|nr:MAG: hypothetical protein A2642_03540 [Candidatus Nomurabacteria bacterium RIFCSPHIGHO2_01_FULL_39_10]
MLHKKDLHLLYELDCNYRKTFTQIGKKIRMSEQLVSYKIHSYEEKKIILDYVPNIDYSRFGYFTFLVFFKVHYSNEQSFDRLIHKLKQHENITSIIECDGNYDLIATFAAKNPSSFNKKLKQLVSENPKELRHHTILTTVVEHHFPRSYLVNSEERFDIILGGDREELPIDETDKKIIHCLINGKKKIIDISQSLKITPKTALNHLHQLEQQQILKAYRVLFNPSSMGVNANIILVRYRNITVDKEEEFRRFCKYHPNVIEFTKTFGEWDVVVHTETVHREQFRKLSLQIREKFDDIIENIDNFRVFANHKKQYLPQEYFDEEK